MAGCVPSIPRSSCAWPSWSTAGESPSSVARDCDARRRYWARSHAGWARIAHATPNAGHWAVADLQGAGLLSGILTQNVDGLHQSAGARDVLELHGNLARVVCLQCGRRSGRSELHERLAAANAGWSGQVTALKPDGDA